MYNKDVPRLDWETVGDDLYHIRAEGVAYLYDMQVTKDCSKHTVTILGKESKKKIGEHASFVTEREAFEYANDDNVKWALANA